MNIKRQKKNKKPIRCLAAVCAALLFVGSICAMADSNNDAINDSKQKIADNKKRVQQIKNEKKAIQDKINELNTKKENVSKYIEELDRQFEDLNAKISDYEKEAEELEQKIVITEEELSEAKQTEADQYFSMKQRIRYMYEHGGMGEADSVLKSKSFSEMLNKAEYIRRISEYDRQKLDEYMAAKEAVMLKEEELKAERDTVTAAKEAAEEDRRSIDALYEEKKKELSSYESEINAANADVGKLQGSISGLEAAIRAEENAIAAIEAEIRRQEEEAMKRALANGEKYEPMTIGDLSFTWPCPGNSRITSLFGDREAPVAGASTNHKGIDISAPTGSKALAAASGTVAIATYSASAGNYVMISHGGGIYTVYMHLSKISVKVGASVSRGQQIGLTGSTGYSTGPHLHFGIRINGSYVNPQVYVAP